MYKTVRQGENSLQYTILPQTEEVLTNSGVKGKGRDYSPTNKPTKSGHSRKEIIVNYLLFFLLALFFLSGLAFSLLAFIGVIPIDRLNSNKTCHEWSSQSSKYTATNLTSHVNSTVIKNATNIQTTETTSTVIITSQSGNTVSIPISNLLSVKSTVGTKPNQPAIEITSGPAQITPTKVKDVLPSGTIYPMDATDYSKIVASATADVEKNSFHPPQHQRQSNNDLMLKHEWTDYDDDDDDDYDLSKISSTAATKTTDYKTIKTDVELNTYAVPTSTPPINNSNILKQNATIIDRLITDSLDDKDLDKNRVKSKMDAVKFKETKERILDDDDDDDEYKEPLTDEDDVSDQTKSDDVKIKAQPKSWLQIRWPFVDPSSYYQWTGNNARDNLLLPAILSAALSALLVIAVLCYALRRRQRCKRRIQEIGNLTSDLQAEDNANLLTAEHSSEDE